MSLIRYALFDRFNCYKKIIIESMGMDGGYSMPKGRYNLCGELLSYSILGSVFLILSSNFFVLSSCQQRQKGIGMISI